MSDLIVEKNPKSPIAEAYRTLRTNIQFTSFDDNIKVIIVTSSGPSEGKTTTAGNLALSFSQTGKKVLIVDCDLRKPSIHKKFQISNEAGLSNMLVGEIKFSEVAHKYGDNLWIIPSGTIPPNPSEMLMSNRFKSFIDEMREKFDCIIIDTPPVIAVTDAQVLSTIADGCILVISSGQAEREAVQKSKELLENVNAKILGVVLNKMDLKSKGSYSYGYYYYYGEEGKKKRRKKA